MACNVSKPASSGKVLSITGFTPVTATAGTAPLGVGALLFCLSALLLLGFLCNWLVTPVSEKLHMSPDEVADEKKQADDTHQHFVADVEALNALGCFDSPDYGMSKLGAAVSAADEDASR